MSPLGGIGDARDHVSGVPSYRSHTKEYIMVSQYEAPSLVVIGTLHELTQFTGTKFPNNFDGTNVPGVGQVGS